MFPACRIGGSGFASTCRIPSPLSLQTSRPVSIASNPAFINAFCQLSTHFCSPPFDGPKHRCLQHQSPGLYSANFLAHFQILARSDHIDHFRCRLWIITSLEIQPAAHMFAFTGLPSLNEFFQVQSGIRGASCPPRLANPSAYSLSLEKIADDIHPAICRSTRRDRKHCRVPQRLVGRLRHQTDFLATTTRHYASAPIAARPAPWPKSIRTVGLAGCLISPAHHLTGT